MDSGQILGDMSRVMRQEPAEEPVHISIVEWHETLLA